MSIMFVHVIKVTKVHKQMREQMAIAMNGGKRVNMLSQCMRKPTTLDPGPKVIKLCSC